MSWSSSSRYAPLIITRTETPRFAASYIELITGLCCPQPQYQSTSRVCCESTTSELALSIKLVIPVIQLSGHVSTSPVTSTEYEVARPPPLTDSTPGIVQSFGASEDEYAVICSN